MILVVTSTVFDASLKKKAREEEKKNEENERFQRKTVSCDGLWRKRLFRRFSETRHRLDGKQVKSS